ncbi:MAG: enoyl-CoA hydratase/isomerase family protein [Methylobacteriaceae bacterium]|nr:enoyl-CoA hydratase/isomerase family protein [Methylobacteriaceae bacterium]
MTAQDIPNSRTDRLRAAGMAPSDIDAWNAAEPGDVDTYRRDVSRYSAFWRASSGLLARLPTKARRSAAEASAAEAILSTARQTRENFLKRHAESVYDGLTGGKSRFLRLDELVFGAAAAVPGLVPQQEQIVAEDGRLQRDKEGLEIDQGIFLAHVLASEGAGRHLCHAMLLPRPQAEELCAKFAAAGRLDLGAASIERHGKAVHIEVRNPRFLNAEDDTTLSLTETCVDLAILDPQTEIAVLRGGAVDHPNYRGRHVLGSGINLTHLYRGKIPFLWFLERDMGYIHKILRGVARRDELPDDVNGRAIEKPWVVALETFAIGGHCQLLLAMDYIIAADDAFMTLPARKEGIIPGLANLRLPRFVGDRIARQAIQYERKLACDGAEGRLICDEIVPATEMEAAIERVVDGLTSAGAVSAIGNRRALRIGQEPLDQFRRYCSAYAREQAYCHFSPALIDNLERNWNAKNRVE